MDWDRLRVFYIVAESGSFTHAATRLDITQSAVSRQISTLEDRMGIPLFHRHARGLLLTEQGELLFRTAREVFTELAMVKTKITENIADAPPLKVSATVGLGATWLVPRLHSFLSQNPDLRLILRVSDSPTDLTAYESHVAISSSVHDDKDLLYKELLCRPLYLYASRSYLAEHGIPLKPEDLDQHKLIAFSDYSLLPFDDANWSLTVGTPPGVKREPYLEINNLYGIARAVEGGSGIACLPSYVLRESKDIVQILPDIESPYVRFYFVYSRQLKDSKKIQSFWEFLKKEAAQEEKENPSFLIENSTK